MSHLSVSIQIVAHNAAKHLRGCLKSILDHADPALEVIVTDDASEDATAAILREIAAADSRVKVITNSSSQGEPECRRMMVEKTSAELIVPFSTADLLIPGRLERQRQILTGVPVLVGTYGKTLGWNEGSCYARYCAGRTFSNFHFFRHRPFDDGALMCRREALLGVGNYAEPVPRAEVDLPGIGSSFTWQRLAMAGPLHFDNSFVQFRRLPEPGFNPLPHLALPGIQLRIQQFMLEFAKKQFGALLQALINGDTAKWREIPPPLLLQLLGLLAVAAQSNRQDVTGLLDRAAMIDPDDYGIAVSRIDSLLQRQEWQAAADAAAALAELGKDDLFVRVIARKMQRETWQTGRLATIPEDAAVWQQEEFVFTGSCEEIDRVISPLRRYIDMAY